MSGPRGLALLGREFFIGNSFAPEAAGRAYGFAGARDFSSVRLMKPGIRIQAPR